MADIFDRTAAEKCVKIVDSAMADNGSLYPGFDAVFMEAMKGLCGKADYAIECIRLTAEETGHWYGAKFCPD